MKSTVKFFVVDTNSNAILGLTDAINFQLIKQINQISEIDIHNKISKMFPGIFEGLGKLNIVHKIELIDQYKPVVQPQRKIPFSLLNKLKIELKNMEQLGVIYSQDKLTEFVSHIIAVEKPNGTLRIYLDPIELNKNIKREHYPLPVIDDILSKLADAKIFSKIDVSNAFWNIPVDTESSKLLTFQTPFGRYSYKRLPFGISSASEVCQKHFSQIIDGLEGVSNHIDDFIVYGKDAKQHDERLQKVIEKLYNAGLKLNKTKCEFNKNSLKYLGHLITDKGISADPDKINSIISLKSPTNVKKLQEFLGLVNYLSKFIKNHSEVTATFRQLLLKNAIWKWQNEEQAFNDL
jgi:hypothetical protein